MKCLLTHILILYISCVVPQAGEKMDYEIKNVTPLDDNGDASKSIPEFVQEAGFLFEEHKVVTADGYILTLWRIYKNKSGPPLILQHGILDDGYSFLLAGTRRSMALYMAKKGYDVWIGNSRGQTYSLGHIENYNWYNPMSKYWDFSFHEMGVYDFPAVVKYVKEETGYEKVNYLGHSQGSTHYFIKGSIDPKFLNENINAFIGLGPAVFVGQPESNLVNTLVNKFPLFDIMHFVGASYFWVLPERILSWFEPLCRSFPQIYHGIVPHIGGYTKKQKFDVRRWPSLCTKQPGGTSTKTLLHWMQVMRTNGRFQMFDYRYGKNMEIYQQDVPKEYELETFKTITVPTLIVSGTRDALVSEQSISKLAETLRNGREDQVLEILKLDDYSHMDFSWGKDSVKELYPHIERFIRGVLKRKTETVNI